MLLFIKHYFVEYLQGEKHWLTSHSAVPEPSKMHCLVLGISDAGWKLLNSEAAVSPHGRLHKEAFPLG